MNFQKLIFITILLTFLVTTPLCVVFYREQVPLTLRSGIPSVILLLFLTFISNDSYSRDEIEIDVIVLFSFFFALFHSFYMTHWLNAVVFLWDAVNKQ